MFRTLAFSIALTLVLVGTASAHSTGLSWEKKAGSYLVDIGYDAPPALDHYSLFDFNLEGQNEQSATFDQVWVRISDKEGAVLAFGLYRQLLGPSTLLYMFPHSGDFTLSASFRD